MVEQLWRECWCDVPGGGEHCTCYYGFRRVSDGTLLIRDREAAVSDGADAICSPRHRLDKQPCEVCKAQVRMVFAAVGGDV